MKMFVLGTKRSAIMEGSSGTYVGHVTMINSCQAMRPPPFIRLISSMEEKTRIMPTNPA